MLGGLNSGWGLSFITQAAFFRIYQAQQRGLIVEDPWDMDFFFLLGLLPLETWLEIIICHPIKLLGRE
jgi:hypothetical protein